MDGHDYAQRAVEAGAAAVLAARPVGVPAIVVDDVVGALGALARTAVERLGTTVVALTGSAGKTSTKDLIAQLLQRKAPTVWTPGSLNNEIGLPLTALRATSETQHLVLEMGARGIGHIHYLADLTPPRTAWSSTSAPPTSGSSAAGRRSRRPRVNWSRCSPRTAAPCSTPTTHSYARWLRAPGPGFCSSEKPRMRTYGARRSG
ncbi:UDP-N-acetylmuramoyl-tripeptide--D-alanyl-D-alanine ligase [Streptomyces microflavus]